jgi:hypothetical protein
VLIILKLNQINVGYEKIFSIGHFMSAHRRWNENPIIEKSWAQFKAHFALHTGSTRKCRVNLQLLQVIKQQTPMWVKQKIKWMRQPLEL